MTKATSLKAHKTNQSAALHRNGASPPDDVGTPDICSASCMRLLSVGIGLRVERFVCLNIADHTWTLVCKSCKCQSLAYIQNFGAMDFVPKKWVLRGINRRPISWSQRLGPSHIAQNCDKFELKCLNTHLSRDIRVEMPRISRITKLRTVRRCIAMYIQPVNSVEPRMSLKCCSALIAIEYIECTLMRSAPSTFPIVLGSGIKPLRRAFATIESGRDTEADDCEPRRSSGSQRSCSIRLTPSWDTRGRDGKRRDCFQFKIFWRVTWRCNEHE
jgi:hypothetical protein